MRIAFFTDTYYPQLNGVTISVDNLAEELREKGHTVYIFAPKLRKRKTKKDDDLTNIRTVSLLARNTPTPVYVPMPTSYREYIKMYRLEFDIIHAHGNGAFSLLGYQVARMKGIPYVLTFHTLLNKYTHYFLRGHVVKPGMVESALKIFANLCDGIITPSEKMKKELLRFGIKKQIHVIPSFVNQEGFAHVKKEYLHKRFEIPASSPILLSVGRLGKEKNFEFIIEIFEELAKKDRQSHLVIVGHGTENKHLRQKVEDLDLSSRIHFTGKINKRYINSVYADADIFVFASVTETQGLVLLEACAAKLPVVVVDDPAFDNMIMNGKNGYVVPLQKKAFVEKIQVLLKDKNLRKTMGEYSSVLLENHFSPDELTDAVLDVYNQALAVKSKERTLYRINRVTMQKLKQATQLLDRTFR
jgi:1,2-diacylglycerol 3-alpha-glucosyltransferase